MVSAQPVYPPGLAQSPNHGSHLLPDGEAVPPQQAPAEYSCFADFYSINLRARKLMIQCIFLLPLLDPQDDGYSCWKQASQE